jgi:hypothetical protein
LLLVDGNYFVRAHFIIETVVGAAGVERAKVKQCQSKSKTRPNADEMMWMLGNSQCPRKNDERKFYKIQLVAD